MLKEFYPCKIDQSMQPAIVYRPDAGEARPLAVCLHTWSYGCDELYEDYLGLCREYGWNMIFPEFRGPNWTPLACGSDHVVSDLEDAVRHMKATSSVDERRVYLIGGSGGGHCSLLMAGRRPDLWAAVSSWCPISDIAQWHRECRANKREGAYADHIEKACGGVPDESALAMAEARLRSPLTWLPNAERVTLDISTGIHDGHRGSVPVSQAMYAFNLLAGREDRISPEDIRVITETETIPEHLRFDGSDPAYGEHSVLFRRQSGHVRLTLFEGAHDLLPATGFSWLERQMLGREPDWSVVAPRVAAHASELSR